MAQSQEPMDHRLTLYQRKKLTLTGVTEVLSFEEDSVVLHTAMGTLTVQGENLKLKNLSQEGGQMEVDGTISVLSYEEPNPGGWLRRMLR